MDYIGIALIILVVVGSVHFVYKNGISTGIEKGRMEILNENVKRVQCQTKEHDKHMESLVNNLVPE